MSPSEDARLILLARELEKQEASLRRFTREMRELLDAYTDQLAKLEQMNEYLRVCLELRASQAHHTQQLRLPPPKQES